MGYLIPKSARSVKIQLFKGLGLAEAGIIAADAVVCVLVFASGWPVVAKVIVMIVLALLGLVMISPSFITNKKGYQSFGVIFDFFSQEKYYKKRNGVSKNGKK